MSESDQSQIEDNQDATANLLQKIMKDPSLAKTLGIFLAQNDGAKSIKRKAPFSPLRVKTIKLAPGCSKDLPGGRSPDRIAPAPETSDNGATLAESQSGEENSLELDSDEDADKKLEDLLNRSLSEQNSSSDENQSDEDDFEIMGKEPSPSWSPSQ